METQKFKETEDAITLHGLGFIQVKLQGNQRLHVWHPELPRRKCFEHSNIHDHRFGFTSLVLVGEQHNQVYSIQQTGNHEKATHVSYLHEGPRSEFGNRPWIENDLLIVTSTYNQAVKAGESYFMQPHVYHSSLPGGDGKLATLMTKTIETDIAAHSLCANGIAPDVDFDRHQWTPSRLWKMVAEVLGGQEIVTPEKIRVTNSMEKREMVACGEDGKVIARLKGFPYQGKAAFEYNCEDSARGKYCIDRMKLGLVHHNYNFEFTYPE